MTNEAKAWAVYESLRNDLKTSSHLFLRIGEKLKEIRDEKLYLHLGDGGFDTFSDFLNNPEIGIRKSTAYVYIGIYEEYRLRLGMSEEDIVEVPINRLMRLRPQIANKEVTEALEIVGDLSVMTNYDFDLESTERGYRIIEKPIIYQSKETDRWVIEFSPEITEKIINVKDKSILFKQNDKNN